MFIKLYEENQEKNLNEIEHLNNILKDLEDAKNNIPKKEYEYEKERITYYLEKEKVKLQENAELIKNYKIIKNELFAIEKLKQYKINDKYDKKEYEEELSRRLETINYYSKNMPQEIYEEILLEINNEFENQTKKGFIDDEVSEEENTNNNEVSEEVIPEVSNESIEEGNVIEASDNSIEEENEPNELEVITDNEISQEPLIEEIQEPIVEPVEEIEHAEVTSEENTKLSGEPTIYEGNVILLPASSDELSKEDSNDTPIELASKAIEIIDSFNDDEEQKTNKEESQEENIDEEELEVEKTDEANPTLISKIKEKMKKYSPKSLISNFKDKHKDQELIEEESQEENTEEQELKVEKVSKANPTLISKIKEKMKKYGVKVLIGLSITTLLAIAISNPITFIPLIEGGSLIGLGLNSMNESEEKKKFKRKGKFLTR